MHLDISLPVAQQKQNLPEGRKKIVVAGKWCGKVWMSNQAHPLLTERDPEEDEIGGPGSVLSNIKIEKRPEITEFRKSVRKRKKSCMVESSVKSKFAKVEAAAVAASGGFRRQPRTNLRKKTTATALLSRTITPPFSMDSGEESGGGGGGGGGSSRRLRKRIIKPPPSPEIKKMSGTKKVKKGLGSGPTMEALVRDEDEDGEFACDMEGCNMSFDSKQELIVHKRNVCPVKGCGKKFFSHKYLVQHRRVHMDDRPLQCPWKGCKMTFKWAWARTEHIRVHTGARPYVCTEDGCGQTFRFVSDFSRHKRKTGHSVKK